MTTVNSKIYSLTDEERELYIKDGFFIRRDAYSLAEVDALGDRVDALIAQVETSEVLNPEQKQTILKKNSSAKIMTGPDSLNSLFRIHMFSNMVREHIRDRRRLDVATVLVGEDLFCPNDLYFLKPAGTGHPIAWHQDSWYFTNTYETGDSAPIEYASIGTWLAIDDARVDNGCLWVIPKSHKQGVIDHEDAGITEALPVKRQAVVPEEMEKHAVPVEVPKGTLVFFNNALLHCSTPNRSNDFRRAYIVHYMKSTIRHTGSGTAGHRQKILDLGWGTPEAYICGRQMPGCVQTTPEEESMNWDKALGRTLTEEDIRIPLSVGMTS